jgi:hypothetical protein
METCMIHHQSSAGVGGEFDWFGYGFVVPVLDHSGLSFLHIWAMPSGKTVNKQFLNKEAWID